MAYIVNNTVGTVIATIADGTIDVASTSITLLVRASITMVKS